MSRKALHLIRARDWGASWTENSEGPQRSVLIQQGARLAVREAGKPGIGQMSPLWRVSASRAGTAGRGAAQPVTSVLWKAVISYWSATLLWELTSFRVWDDLVNESGLTPDRYVEIVTATALAALASSLGEQASPSP